MLDKRKYHIFQDGQVRGPFSEDALAGLIALKRIAPTDQYHDGDAWRPVHEFEPTSPLDRQPDLMDKQLSPSSAIALSLAIIFLVFTLFVVNSFANATRGIGNVVYIVMIPGAILFTLYFGGLFLFSNVRSHRSAEGGDTDSCRQSAGTTQHQGATALNFFIALGGLLLIIYIVGQLSAEMWISMFFLFFALILSIPQLLG